jgi:hypothetical protein
MQPRETIKQLPKVASWENMWHGQGTAIRHPSGITAITRPVLVVAFPSTWRFELYSLRPLSANTKLTTIGLPVSQPNVC